MSKSKATLIMWLTGISGAGKTTTGRLLARRLGGEFCDTDYLIESAMKKSVAQIFAEDGVQAFRRKEREIIEGLARSASLGTVVVALGGGALLHSRNLRTVLGSGELVYLHTPATVAAERLMRNRTRPLLRGANGKQLSRSALTNRLRLLAKDRRAGFKCATIVVGTSGRTPQEVCREIQTAFPGVSR